MYFYLIKMIMPTVSFFISLLFLQIDRVVEELNGRPELLHVVSEVKMRSLND